jgi:hypothetical protein
MGRRHVPRGTFRVGKAWRRIRRRHLEGGPQRRLSLRLKILVAASPQKSFPGFLRRSQIVAPSRVQRDREARIARGPDWGFRSASSWSRPRMDRSRFDPNLATGRASRSACLARKLDLSKRPPRPNIFQTIVGRLSGRDESHVAGSDGEGDGPGAGLGGRIELGGLHADGAGELDGVLRELAQVHRVDERSG